MVNREALTMVDTYTFYKGDHFMDFRQGVPLDNRNFSLAGHFGEDGLVLQYKLDGHTEEMTKATFGNLVSIGDFEHVFTKVFGVGDRLVSKFSGKEIVILGVSPKKSDQDDEVYYFVSVYSYQDKISYQAMAESQIVKLFDQEGLVVE